MIAKLMSGIDCLQVDHRIYSTVLSGDVHVFFEKVRRCLHNSVELKWELEVFVEETFEFVENCFAQFDDDFVFEMWVAVVFVDDLFDEFDDFYVCDVISDILSGGRSSRFYQRLMKEKEIISYADAYITGTVDPGLFLIEAKPTPGCSVSALEEALWAELEELKDGNITSRELQRIKNKIESALVYSEINILNKAVNLSYYEMLGNAELINTQADRYKEVTIEDISKVARKIFTKNNCTEVVYIPENENTQ